MFKNIYKCLIGKYIYELLFICVYVGPFFLMGSKKSFADKHSTSFQFGNWGKKINHPKKLV